MSLISKSNKFIYVSGGKCATNSIHAAFKDNKIESFDYSLKSYKLREKYARHIPAEHLRRMIGRKKWDDRFKFTFVRNPYEWVVSSFFFMVTREHSTVGLPEDGIMKLEHFETIRDYYATPNGRRHDGKSPVRSQLSFISDSEGPIVDFIGRFENLNEDFAYICGRIGIAKLKLGCYNKTEYAPYKEHYTKETKEFVEENWGKDIEHFKYKL